MTLEYHGSISIHTHSDLLCVCLSWAGNHAKQDTGSRTFNPSYSWVLRIEAICEVVMDLKSHEPCWESFFEELSETTQLSGIKNHSLELHGNMTLTCCQKFPSMNLHEFASIDKKVDKKSNEAAESQWHLNYLLYLLTPTLSLASAELWLPLQLRKPRWPSHLSPWSHWSGQHGRKPWAHNAA